MKKYSSKQAKKGKLAFRTPSPVRYRLILRNQALTKEKISNGASRFIPH